MIQSDKLLKKVLKQTFEVKDVVLQVVHAIPAKVQRWLKGYAYFQALCG